MRKAEERILEIRKKYPKRLIYIPGFLINNRNYIKYLSSLHILTKKDTDPIPPDSLVVIRTHGISRFKEEKIRNTNEIIDLTCRNVKKVQKTIMHYSQNEYSVLITGKKHHPEVKGLVSYARISHVIEDYHGQEFFLQNSDKLLLFPEKKNKLLIISQTTGNRALFTDTVKKVKEKWDKHGIIKSIDTICPMTDKKEDQALELLKQCDVGFVLGDPLSSNAKKLYQRLSAAFHNVHFIEDLEMLQSLSLPLQHYHSALVVSSASTPNFIEKEVRLFLEQLST